MRKWIYKTLGHSGTVTTEVDGDVIELEAGTYVYLASEVDARIAELEAALRELVEQADDYFYGDSGFPFKDAVDRAKSVL